MRLLLVEDERQLSEALTELLIKNKYCIDAVYDGETGLDYALTGRYDVIVLDIMLPKLNGLDMLQQLRANGISTPTILLTAKGDVKDRVTGLDCEGCYLIQKIGFKDVVKIKLVCWIHINYLRLLTF
jgi:DNA-binding response OmpR family regulator